MPRKNKPHYSVYKIPYVRHFEAILAFHSQHTKYLLSHFLSNKYRQYARPATVPIMYPAPTDHLSDRNNIVLREPLPQFSG